MTYYRRPTRLVQVVNRLISWLAAAGLAPSRTIVLEVKGRRSGRLRSTVLNTVKYEGATYLVSPRGETEWVRNVRAAGGEAVIRHGRRQRVRLEEVPAAETAPILRAYLKENGITKPYFGIDPGAPLEEFQGIAARHPVFRVLSEQ